MDFSYTEEQTSLQDTLRRFVAKDYGFEQRRNLLKSAEGFSREAWGTYAELGILALTFRDDVGGLGGSAVDTMIVMQALAPGLVLEPYVATVVLAGSLVDAFGTDAQRKRIVGAIAEGKLLLSLAHQEPGGRYALSHVSTTATKQGAGYVLQGHKAVVLGGASADQLLVSARTAGATRDADGVSLFLVDRKATGVTVRSYATQDGQRAADIVLDKVTVTADALIGSAGTALPAIEAALDRANAALVAEAVGVMSSLGEHTLEYLKNRKQFGQPIGKFQVLQHRMAEMTIATEQSRSMALLAAVNVDNADADARRRAVSGAKAYVAQQSRFAGQAAIQMHGGMGVTDELIVSHYFKRLTMIAATFGDEDHHRARYSRVLETGVTGAAAIAPVDADRMSASDVIPAGFAPVVRKLPGFMALCGPLYEKPPSTADGLPVAAIRVEEKHLNMRGIVHGGMLVTLADSALGRALNHARKVPLSLVTVSLTTDFADAAKLGDWIEAHVDIQKIGSRMAFANCYLKVGERRILRASGVFAVVKPADAKEERFDG